MKQDKTYNPDIFGEAVHDYFIKGQAESIRVWQEDFDEDEIPTAYLFRAFKDMPAIEQIALKNSFGHCLDVGCCAGSHSLHLQQKGLEVTAIDISAKAIEVCRLRGIKDAQVKSFFEVEERYDTILMLMNGSGIIGKLNQLNSFFQQLKKILKPGGQLLIDSSDLRYLYEEEDESLSKITSQNYYGEVQYQIQYKEQKSQWFDWLYIDFEKLKLAASAQGFSCKQLVAGEHYDYLAQITYNN
ncbi:class I SAM-dependent methyltransferase [Mesonia sediminis]|uniref:Class I SAM-dependent methyltransferase n=1 Tax=Mesonia sediminis TaxID=1703946 RepID=A0ABW5SBY4_9FLAO